MGLLFSQVDFFVGYTAGLKGFTAAVLGGIGSIPGAMLGGFLLGIAESFSTAFISSAYKDVIAFLILILVLIFKPAGPARESRTGEGLGCVPFNCLPERSVTLRSCRRW